MGIECNRAPGKHNYRNDGKLGLNKADLNKVIVIKVYFNNCEVK
jgi:hypothetical protein